VVASALASQEEDVRGLSLAIFATFGLTLSACSSYGNFPTHHTHLSTSAEKILRRSVRDVRGWTKDDRVAIVNLDSVLAEDERIPALVEDALVSAVVDSGIAVVERDSDALRWLAQEGSGDRITFGATGYSKDADHQMVIDAELMGARRYVPGSRYLLDGENYIELPPGTDLMELGPDPGDDRITRVPLPQPPTLVNEILAATKLLQFRIIDISIREEPRDDDVLRHANVVLVLRLVDSRYGTVVWSGLVQDVVTDTIPSALAGELRKIEPDSPSKAAPDSHAPWGERLWKRPRMRNSPDTLILCCDNEDSKKGGNDGQSRRPEPREDRREIGLAMKPDMDKPSVPELPKIEAPELNLDKGKIARIGGVAVGGLAGLYLTNQSRTSLQDVKTYKAEYDTSTDPTSMAEAEAAYKSALVSTLLKGTAGLVTLGATGAFVAVKGISTDGQGLVFSGTW
jgi:hypothetical protein